MARQTCPQAPLPSSFLGQYNLSTCSSISLLMVWKLFDYYNYRLTQVSTHIQMFINGLTIDTKKLSLSKKTSQHQQPRPSSSELPQIPEVRPPSTKLGLLREQNRLPKEAPRRNTNCKTYLALTVPSKQNQHASSEHKINLKPIREDRLGKSKKIQLQQEQNLKLQYQKAVMAYFRYYPLAIAAACGTKQFFMRQLGQQGTFQVYQHKGKKMARKGLEEAWAKLIKIAQLKGKYKYREKFNFMASPQMKVLALKRKQAKKKKSESSQSEEQPQHKEKCRDMQSWKKSVGAQGCSVFIIKGGYKDLKNALLERGWVQNPDPNSHFYNFKWTTKVNGINYESLQAQQVVNHFNNNACLTSKYGICKSLRSVMFSQRVDVDQFFPKAFDLSDLHDFQNFLQVYKWIFCESLLKKAQETQPAVDIQGQIKIAFVVTARRLLRPQKLLANLIANRFNLCTPAQWRFLLQPQQFKSQEVMSTLAAWQLLQLSWTSFYARVTGLLQRLKQRQPQYELNGKGNIWIIKPAFLSRGRGIKCYSQLGDILDLSIGRETQYVAQKYLENPLIINDRKFDIRQWVLVQDYNPPRIWFYGEFYLRFCLQKYDPKQLNNRYAHLANNSIQKYNKQVTAQMLQKDSMWHKQTFKEWLNTNYGQGKMKELVSRMKEIVVATIISTQDQVSGRKRSFELIGYDFMIDSNLNPWLLEINSSPAMDYSTEVTRKLVKLVLQDTVKVVIDNRQKKTKKKTAGLFRLIYDGESTYNFKHYAISPQTSD